VAVTVLRYRDIGGWILGRTKKQYRVAVKTLQLEAKTTALRAIQEQIGQTDPLPVDRGTYRRGWTTTNLPDGVMIYNAEVHAAVIEHGRRPGARMPPPAVLGEWARRKGLLRDVPKRGRQAAQRSLGFVIARAIARKGLPARRVLDRARQVFWPAIKRAVRLAMKAAT
jgi:hypothetical protein